jgi:hypothetical protein
VGCCGREFALDTGRRIGSRRPEGRSRRSELATAIARREADEKQKAIARDRADRDIGAGRDSCERESRAGSRAAVFRTRLMATAKADDTCARDCGLLFLHDSSHLLEQICRYMDGCSRRSPDRSGAIGIPRRQTVLADLCGQRAGRWPNHHARRQVAAFDSVGVSTTTPFEANFQNPDPQGGTAQRIVPAQE